MIRVIVADNDDLPHARDLAEQTARCCSLPLTYVHAPARNISVARNACLDTITAPYAAFIDDDEVADPSWLTELMTTADTTGADVVLGPVEADYPSNCPDWIKKGDFHSIEPVWVNDEIITGYTSNVLLRRLSPALKNLRFRNELGRSGGEDTLFFLAVHRSKGRIVYAPNAVVTEAVRTERMRMSWLMGRFFRSGQTHGLVLLEQDGTNPLARVKNIAIACTKIGFCLVAALLTVASSVRATSWFLRGIMHMGVIARLMGKRELQQYGLKLG